jgi:hypothetical protein
MSDAYLGSPSDHEALAQGKKIKRSTYAVLLGRQLAYTNGVGMQWGDRYIVLHTLVWKECARVMRPGGQMILNIKNHVRKGEVVDVAGWHVATLKMLGFLEVNREEVDTPGFRHGQNRELRCPELLISFVKALPE